MNKMERFFWYSVGFIILIVVVFKGLCFLVGAEFMLTIARSIAYIAVPTAAGWLIFAIVGTPIALIRRFMAVGRKNLAKCRMYEAKAMAIVSEAKAKYRQSQYSTTAGKYVLAIDNDTGRQKYYIAPTKADLQEEEPQTKPEYTVIDILRIIAKRLDGTKNAPRFVFAGPPRAGKTFTAIRAAAMIPGVFYALDPKLEDPEEPWPDWVTVHGRGDNWAEMIRFFEWIINEEQPRRAALMQSNPAAFKKLPKIVVFLDELISTVRGEKKIADYYITVLTKFSQFGIGVIVITHAVTATAMGFKKGEAQLMDSFDAVFRFDYDIWEDERSVFCKLRGKDEIPLLPFDDWDASPTPHTPHQKDSSDGFKRCFLGGVGCVGGVGSKINYDPNIKSVEPVRPTIIDFYEHKEHKIICEAYRDGASKREISRRINLEPGGTANKKINAVLRKYGIGTGG